jgi:hypothetical protein
MTTAELTTCCEPEDSAPPTPVGGYVVVCVVSYERGFDMPQHQFFCSLLQFYGLELHRLTPNRIQHMVAFMTLCESYMGIEPHFDLQNYFFRAQLQQGSDAEAITFGNVDIFV